MSVASFYAQQESYVGRDFVQTQPYFMLTEKEYLGSDGNAKPFTFELDKKTASLWNNKKQAPFYNMWDYKITSYPKYGKLVHKNEYDYEYTPNLNHSNNLDEFVYDVKVKKNDEGAKKLVC